MTGAERFELGLNNNFRDYQLSLAGPERPAKPRLASQATAAEVRAYADLLDDWEKKKAVFDDEMKKRNEQKTRLFNQFSEDAADYHGLKGHPKWDLLFRLAWDYGHSDGYHTVATYLDELSDLLK